MVGTVATKQSKQKSKNQKQEAVAQTRSNAINKTDEVER